MNTAKKVFRKKLLYTAFMLVLMCAVLVSSLSIVHYNAENLCYENLHSETQRIKEEITLQLNSDYENLLTMSRIATGLYKKGEDMHVLLDSYTTIGLIENIGFLMPDGSFITKAGTIQLGADVYQYELGLGGYISGRTRDFTAERAVIRSACPVIVDYSTVAILYGVTDVSTLEEKYTKILKSIDGKLYVFERGSGNAVFDTFEKASENIHQLSDRKYNHNFTYDEMITNIKAGKEGFSSFVSLLTDENLYVHYAPIDISDWGILLARPQDAVLADSRHTTVVIITALLCVAAILAIYFVVLFSIDRARTRQISYSSAIRKTLLGITGDDGIIQALKIIVHYCGSRSAFYVDTDGDDYNFISPSFSHLLLKGDQHARFVSFLMGSSAANTKKNGVAVEILTHNADKKLETSNPDFYELLTNNGINSVTYVIIHGKNNQKSILGVTNQSSGTSTRELLGDIAACFSLTVGNRRYLLKTEADAVTDSLTSCFNRIAYTRQISVFNEEHPENLGCVYIDANELHMFNNRYGHASGDEMLLYIANTLKEVFFGHPVYRIGGDEFLVFIPDATESRLENAVTMIQHQVDVMNYKISAGVAVHSVCDDAEALVSEAEKKMFEAKAAYYQLKDQNKQTDFSKTNFKHIATGNEELDTVLGIMSKHYRGIYGVSLKTDKVNRIVMPSYLDYGTDNICFKDILARYVNENVNPDFHRGILSLLDYDVLAKLLAAGESPLVSYKKINGESMALSIHRVGNADGEPDNTIWLFEIV